MSSTLLEAKQYDNGLLKKILSDQEFTDVTLVTEDGKDINAHRVVLSASSHFFQQVFKRNPKPQTLIYIDNVSHVVLEALVHFMYTEQVKIKKNKLKRFLEIGEKFKIDGLLIEDEISEKETSSGDINTDLIKPEVNINGEEDVFLDYTSILDYSNTDVYARENDFNADVILSKLKEEKEDFIESSNYEGIEDEAEIINMDNREYKVKDVKHFQCVNCPYRSKFKGGLRIHKETVHDLITHPCDLCDKKFTQKSHLYNHKRTVHDGMKYSCKYCVYTNTKRCNMKYHIAKRHPELKNCDDNHSF